ncbi:hypothetical protein ACFLUP_03195 [Chloroflexota bacterium]
MVVLSDATQQELHSLLKLQKNIKRIDAARWDASVKNFLASLSKFVEDHNPAGFTIGIDGKGNPEVSFSWSD